MIRSQFAFKQQKKSKSQKFSSHELQILQFWKHNQIFQRLKLQAKQNPPFIIYDGPPFPTGDPHFGHICVSVIKDVISRYKFQTGYSVIDQLGWDCHGLPVEHEANLTLGVGKLSELQQLSIEKYNSVCKQLVIKYCSQWEEVIQRYGRWCDFSQTYKTMDMQYMQSVWYIFKTLFDRNLIYRQKKIVPYSSYLHTPLSNFQQQLNYKEVQVLSTWIAFPIVNDQNTKMIVQTCNLWTLPTNLALAVNPNVDYIKIKHQKTGQIFILAQKSLLSFYRNKANQFTRISNIKGIDLRDLQYVPVFNFLQHLKQYGCFKVLLADFVDEFQGSGIRHCSPAFDQLELELCLRSKIVNEHNIPIYLDQMGRFTKQIPKFEGILFHDIDEIIVSQLKYNQRLLKSEKNRKSKPFCWRSNCPLMHRLANCWFLKVECIKQSIISNHEKVEWCNKALKQKRFLNWLKDCKDWCISRNQFWGNPIPLWISDDGQQIYCVSSKEELERLTGVRIQDLHRNSIDHLTIESKEGRGKLKRIEEVFDCWFESGSMPFAHLHYPFSCNQHQIRELFPADVIVEGIDQTRGWFYTLQVIATALRSTNPIKQIFVNGLILADSFKFDKNKAKDYAEPINIAQNYGADAVRLYLMLSRATIADNVIFSEYQVKDCMNSILVPWFKAFQFLVQCICNFEKRQRMTFELVSNIEDLTQKNTVIDNWILSKLQQLITFTFNQMNSYNIHQAVKQITRFMNELTQWYIELNKDIISGGDSENNGIASLNVLCYCFVQTSIILNPFTPFLTQHMYQNLRKHLPSTKQSINYLPFPTPIPSLINTKINIAIKQMKYVIETLLFLREKNKIPNTKILNKLKIITNDDKNIIGNLFMLVDYVKKLGRVSCVQFKTGLDLYVRRHCVINMPVFGPKIRGKNVSVLRDKIMGLSQKQIGQLMQSEQVQIAGHRINTKTDIKIETTLQRDRIEKYQAMQGNSQIIVIIDTRTQQLTNVSVQEEKDEMP